MNSLTDIILSKRRAVLLVLFLVIVIGTTEYINIPKERDPDIQLPIIYVSIHLEGVSPEDGERLLIRPMEVELEKIEGLKEIEATASTSHASIFLEFNSGFDSDKALADVREAVDIAKAELPQDADEPIIREISFSQFPVLSIVLKSSLPERNLIKIARDLSDRIEQIPSVLSVDIGGDREETVDVLVTPVSLEGYSLGTDIISSIRNNNTLVSSGFVDNGDGRYDVKVDGLIDTIEEITNLPIKANGDAGVILKDVGSVRSGFKDRVGYARLNGESAIVLDVSKRSGENIINTIEEVKSLVGELGEFWPEGIKVIYLKDESKSIVDILIELQNNIILAIFLVLVVVIYFVGIRSGALIAIAIPGAFLIGIITLSFLGVTLNIVVLFSLILSIGMLVDSAIIVVEYASRQMQLGKTPTESYAAAAKKMFWPIVASTATTLVVFAPLLFWPGIMGGFMKNMPLTLIATLSGSLLMALIFLPALGGIFDRADHKEKNRDLISDKHRFVKSYVFLLTKVIHHPKKFLFLFIVLLVGVVILYVSLSKGSEFFPSIEPENAQVLVKNVDNLSIEEKDSVMKEIEKLLFPMLGEIKSIYTRTGKTSQGRDLSDEVIGFLQIEFADWKKRRKVEEIIVEINERLENVPGVEIEVLKEQMGPTSSKPIEIQLASTSLSVLKEGAKKLEKGLRDIGGVVGIENTLPVPKVEWNIEVDRKSVSRFGLDINTIGLFIRLVTNGIIIDDYRPDDVDDKVDIVLRFPKEYRNFSQLDQLMISTEQGKIPLSNVAKRIAKQTTGNIKRSDGKRVVTVKADVADGVIVNNKIKEIVAWVKSAYEDKVFDRNISISFKGDQEDQKETANFLAKSFLIALTIMILILLIQFNSFYYVFIIMSAIFLSTIGVIVGLMVTSQAFGIVMCGVGIISLAGIVVNNNIIFIDTYKFYLGSGLQVKEALIRTGAERLRPILLTAGTTVLGLIPMVLTMNINFITREVTFGAPSSQWWQQLSTSIAGGLSFATILTLFLTPALLSLEKNKK